MTPEELVQALSETSSKLASEPSSFTNEQLNAIDAYSRGLGKHARTIIRGRECKIRSKPPMEW